jgi:hypothetical protein
MSRSRIKCGDFGGINAKGEPCGVASVDGPCARHRDEVANVAAHHFNPGTEFIVPPFQRTKDKVCIVGFTEHRSIAETLDRDEWEIWGLNELYRYMKPSLFDRWFEIHGREYLCKDEDGEKHIEDLKKFPIPVYMQQVHADIPASVRFPKDEIIDALDSRYWTNCPAWMLGMAIVMGFETIWLIGVDMAQDSEYYTQRTCCEHWLGYARGKGIDVWVPEDSDLLKSMGLYGYDDEGNRLSRKLQKRLEWLHTQDNERLGMIRKLEADYTEKKGKMQRAQYLLEGAIAEIEDKEGPGVPERIAELKDKHEKASGTLAQMGKEYTIKHQRLRDERNQLVGGINDVKYILRSWLLKADNADGGNIPSRDTRAADPRTGIAAPSGDNANSIAQAEVGALVEV